MKISLMDIFKAKAQPKGQMKLLAGALKTIQSGIVGKGETEKQDFKNSFGMLLGKTGKANQKGLQASGQDPQASKQVNSGQTLSDFDDLISIIEYGYSINKDKLSVDEVSHVKSLLTKLKNLRNESIGEPKVEKANLEGKSEGMLTAQETDEANITPEVKNTENKQEITISNINKELRSLPQKSQNETQNQLPYKEAGLQEFISRFSKFVSKAFTNDAKLYKPESLKLDTNPNGISATEVSISKDAKPTDRSEKQVINIGKMDLSVSKRMLKTGAKEKSISAENSEDFRVDNNSNPKELVEPKNNDLFSRTSHLSDTKILDELAPLKEIRKALGSVLKTSGDAENAKNESKSISIKASASKTTENNKIKDSSTVTNQIPEQQNISTDKNIKLTKNGYLELFDSKIEELFGDKEDFFNTLKNLYKIDTDSLIDNTITGNDNLDTKYEGIQLFRQIKKIGNASSYTSAETPKTNINSVDASNKTDLLLQEILNEFPELLQIAEYISQLESGDIGQKINHFLPDSFTDIKTNKDDIELVPLRQMAGTKGKNLEATKKVASGFKKLYVQSENSNIIVEPDTSSDAYAKEIDSFLQAYEPDNPELLTKADLEKLADVIANRQQDIPELISHSIKLKAEYFQVFEKAFDNDSFDKETELAGLHYSVFSNQYKTIGGEKKTSGKSILETAAGIKEKKAKLNHSVNNPELKQNAKIGILENNTQQDTSQAEDQHYTPKTDFDISQQPVAKTELFSKIKTSGKESFRKLNKVFEPKANSYQADSKTYEPDTDKKLINLESTKTQKNNKTRSGNAIGAVEEAVKPISVRKVEIPVGEESKQEEKLFESESADKIETKTEKPTRVSIAEIKKNSIEIPIENQAISQIKIADNRDIQPETDLSDANLEADNNTSQIKTPDRKVVKRAVIEQQDSKILRNNKNGIKYAANPKKTTLTERPIKPDTEHNKEYEPKVINKSKTEPIEFETAAPSIVKVKTQEKIVNSSTHPEIVKDVEASQDKQIETIRKDTITGSRPKLKEKVNNAKIDNETSTGIDINQIEKPKRVNIVNENQVPTQSNEKKSISLIESDKTTPTKPILTDNNSIKTNRFEEISNTELSNHNIKSYKSKIIDEKIIENPSAEKLMAERPIPKTTTETINQEIQQVEIHELKEPTLTKAKEPSISSIKANTIDTKRDVSTASSGIENANHKTPIVNPLNTTEKKTQPERINSIDENVKFTTTGITPNVTHENADNSIDITHVADSIPEVVATNPVIIEAPVNKTIEAVQTKKLTDKAKIVNKEDSPKSTLLQNTDPEPGKNSNIRKMPEKPQLKATDSIKIESKEEYVKPDNTIIDAKQDKDEKGNTQKADQKKTTPVFTKAERITKPNTQSKITAQRQNTNEPSTALKQSIIDFAESNSEILKYNFNPVENESLSNSDSKNLFESAKNSHRDEIAEPVNPQTPTGQSVPQERIEANDNLVGVSEQFTPISSQDDNTNSLLIRTPVKLYAEEIQDEFLSIVRANIGTEENQISIALKPEGLGRIVMSISQVEKTLNLDIKVRDDEIKEVLERGIEALKAEFAGKELKIQEVKIEVNDNLMSNQDNNKQDYNRESRRNRNMAQNREENREPNKETGDDSRKKRNPNSDRNIDYKL